MQVFHFFKNQTTIITTNCLPRVLATACRVVDSIKILNQKLDALATAPVQVHVGLLLASMILLRILKCFASRDLDIERAKTCFFTAINLEKQMSVDANDAPAKAVLILNQLWNSSKAFRKADGSEYTTLRIRSRLVLSPVLDAVWWWRDEFDPLTRALASSQGAQPEGILYVSCSSLFQNAKLSIGIELSRENTGGPVNPFVGPIERQEPLHLDDQFLADFEWALGDDGMFPPTEPYSSTWTSAGNLI